MFAPGSVSKSASETKTSEAKTSETKFENLLEKTNLPKGKLSSASVFLDCLTGDLYREFKSHHDATHRRSFIDEVIIQNKKTEETGSVSLPPYALFVFDWPTFCEEHLFASLHLDQIIIWDASVLNNIKQLRIIPFRLKMKGIEDVRQVEVFPGNGQLAIWTEDNNISNEILNVTSAIYLVDIRDHKNPNQERFAINYGYASASFIKESVETLMKFCIVDETHIALYMTWVNEQQKSDKYYLRVRIWEFDFNRTFRTWRISDVFQNTERNVARSGSNDFHISQRGKFLAIFGRSFMGQPAVQAYTLVDYKYARCGQLTSATPLGFSGDDLLIAFTEQEISEKIIYETYRFNLITGEKIKIVEGDEYPKMSSSRCLMFAAKEETVVFDVSIDPRPRLLATELADVLQRFSLDLVNKVFEFLHRRADPRLFRSTPEKRGLDIELMNIFNYQHQVLIELGNKLSFLPREKQKLEEARADLGALEKFAKNAKAGMSPSANVMMLRIKFPNMSKQLDNLLDIAMSIDPISLAYEQQKRLTVSSS